MSDGQIKSYIDRVLRLKEEQDALSQDIREIYKEAKGNGYDKTALGNVVAHLRKVDKKGRDAIHEAETIFDLYLTAYEGTGTPFATHTHETNSSGESRERQKVGSGPISKPEATLTGALELPPAGTAAPITHPQEASSSRLEADKAETAPPPVVSAAFSLRPHCQVPDNCAGYGSKHCHACLKAAQESEAA